jgi:hypothetical protein
VNAIPLLLNPADLAVVSGNTTFSWQWSGPALAPNQAFEVRLWKDGQPDHYGATAPARSPSVTFDVNGAYGVQQGGSGRYLWTVALIETDPYRRIGQEAPARPITVQVSSAGDNDGNGGGGGDPGPVPTRTPEPPPP